MFIMQNENSDVRNLLVKTEDIKAKIINIYKSVSADFKCYPPIHSLKPII